MSIFLRDENVLISSSTIVLKLLKYRPCMSLTVMGFGRFEIVLENRNGIFYPGQTVIGTVYITTSKTESLKGKIKHYFKKCELKSFEMFA